MSRQIDKKQTRQARIPSELHRLIKLRAAQENTSILQVIVDVFRKQGYKI